MKNIFQTPSGKWDSKIAFTPSEVCEMLGLARSTLSEFYLKGKLKVMKGENRYRILRSALEEFLADAEE